MNKYSKLLLLILPLALASCFQTNGSGKKATSKPVDSSSEINSGVSGDTQTTTGTTTSDSSASVSSTSGGTNTSQTSSSTSEDIGGDSNIVSISLDKRESDVLLGHRNDSLIVTFHLQDPSASYDNSVNWSSSNSSIASVDQYGRVTGNALGQTVVTATTVEGGRKASCVIYVLSEAQPYTIEWQKVTHQNQLAVGDILVIGCPQAGKTATSESTGMYLHSVNSTFSSDGSKITSLNASAEQFVLDGATDNWTLENEDGYYLATTHTGKVTFIYKTGNVRWEIDYDNEWNCCDMRSSSNIDGWFMYNQSADKFTTYESSEQVDMFVITLYKQVKIRN